MPRSSSSAMPRTASRSCLGRISRGSRMDETKYRVPESEGEILPNLLGLTERKAIDEAELEGFYQAEAIIIEELSTETKFNLEYIYRIHKIALSAIYSFAG